MSTNSVFTINGALPVELFAQVCKKVLEFTEMVEQVGLATFSTTAVWKTWPV